MAASSASKVTSCAEEGLIIIFQGALERLAAFFPRDTNPDRLVDGIQARRVEQG
jgi:hypothetical protein